MIESGKILVNRYEIQNIIGSGGMADVYRAKDHKLNRLVAIKILKEEYSKDAQFVKKFHVEAQAAAGLMHTNIVNIYDVGEEKGFHFIVMELVDGISLESYIKKAGRIAPKEAVNFALQICKGIEAAHKNGTVHRDIKPQNILVTTDGTLKVTDFGIAKAATSNTITVATIGSVHYISPEQARGGYSDQRSDIYSLGITLYEMVTGKVPFDGNSQVAIALMHLQDEFVRPRQYFSDIPQSLENIIVKATRKKKEERYASVAEMIADLQHVFEQDGSIYQPLTQKINPDMTKVSYDAEKTTKLMGNDTRVIDRMEQRSVRMPEEKIEKQPSKFKGNDSTDKKIDKLILILIGIAGVIVAIGVIAILVKGTSLFKNNDTKTTTTATQESTTQSTESTTEATTEEETEEVIMPNVVGKEKQEAIDILVSEEYHLKADFTEEYSDDVEKNHVIRQNIPEGNKILKYSIVMLTISKGSDKIEVKDVVGKKEAKAKDILSKQGFSVSVTEEYSDSVKEGNVIKQSPKAGSKEEKDAKITLTVSKGAQKVSVPDLRYYTKQEAKEQLKNAELSLGDVSEEYSDSIEKGQVISQSVKKGEKVEKGTSIDIVVSKGEEPAPVTYSYKGSITITDAPFAEPATEGKIKLVFTQGGKKKAIYDEKIEATDFPISVSFDGYEEGDGVVTMYCDGNEVDSYTVTMKKVENE